MAQEIIDSSKYMGAEVTSDPLSFPVFPAPTLPPSLILLCTFVSRAEQGECNPFPVRHD